MTDLFPAPSASAGTTPHDLCRRAAAVMREHARPDCCVVVPARTLAAMAGVLDASECGDEPRLHDAVTRLASALLADPPRTTGSHRTAEPPRPR